MTRLVFDVPDDNTPGYLLRARRALEFQAALKKEQTPETLTAMVEFLAEFVSEPVEQSAKIEALWNASKAEFSALLAAITGGGDENPTSAPTI